MSPSRARSNANLVPFQKGHDPRRNTGGSPGAAYIRYKQNLAREDNNGRAVYSTDDLKAILEDPYAPHPKAGAARELLGIRTKGFSAGGRPLAIEDVREMLDRELGKPHQRMLVQTQELQPLEDAFAAMRLLLEAHPILKVQLEEQLHSLLPGGGGAEEAPDEAPGLPPGDATT